MIVNKYNYNNHKCRETILTIRDEKLFYLTKNNILKEMKYIIGFVHGSCTWTWKNKLIWRKYTVNSSLCLSLISHNRTYDFEFYSLDNILSFLYLTRNLKTNYVGINELYINRPYHHYTKEYITHYNNIYNTNDLPCTNIWSEFIRKNKWDYTLNKPFINASIQNYKNITHSIKSMTTNHSCCICLDDWDEDDICKIFHCKHILHMECFKRFPSERNLICPCCRANVSEL